MYIALGIMLGIVLLVVLFLFSSAWIHVSFSYLGGKPVYSLTVGIGWLRLNLTKFLQKKLQESPKAQTKDKKETEEEKKKLTFQDIEKALSKIIEVLQYLRKKFTVRLFSFKARMGVGDAADTGIATGAAYGSIYSLLGMADRFFVLKKHEVIITPVFQGVGLETEIHGEFGLRVIYCLGLLNKIRKEDVK